MDRKKEDPEKVKARVKRYLETHSQLLITGLSNDDKQLFIDIKGLEDLSHSKKLVKLVEFWNEQHKKPIEEKPIKAIVNINDEKKKPLAKKVVIDSFENLNEKFIDFLYEFKIYNRTKTGLRKKGRLIKDELHNNPELNISFKKICERLPDRIVKSFKPMYLQGYFFLSESDIIEISKVKELDSMILLLFKTIEFMNKDNPLQEAKKEVKV